MLDVRDAGQLAKDHIPGAVNIEWRQVFAQRAKLPEDKTIIVYCNIGSFAGQVAMAARMDGFENVRVLHGGFNEWKTRGGTDAYARATKKGCRRTHPWRDLSAWSPIETAARTTAPGREHAWGRVRFRAV